MAKVRHGMAVWPGVVAVCSAQYTVSQGMTPGVALLRCHPQPVFPKMYGNLVITDGIGSVTIPNCKLDALKVEHGSDGIIWNLEIVDRRWKWRNLGSIFGCYNQIDEKGKLIPWSIRSPIEMAILCLQRMGEPRYTIDLPAGLGYANGAGIDRLLKAGENFVPTGVNPPINWEGEPPAQALQQLCDQFGRIIVYDLGKDSVTIARQGIGKYLPLNESIAKQGPSLKSPQMPDGVGVIGGPIKYQPRLLIDPVGEEWDGSYKPIDTLSYAPVLPGKKQITTITITDTAAAIVATQKYQVYIRGNDWPANPDGWRTEYGPTGLDDDNEVAAQLLDAINESDDPRVRPFVTATRVNNVITLTGKQVGVPFAVDVAMFTDPAPGKIAVNMTQAAQKSGKSWEYCAPPGFWSVQATDRLTYGQALELAQKSVWKCFQVSDVDASGKGKIKIPGYLYNPLKRKQQILLLDTQVDQVVPQPPDRNVVDRANQPLTVNFYNGYSRDKPAAVYGSISTRIKDVMRLQSLNVDNTPFGQLYLNFSIDPTWQLVTFSEHIYKEGPNGKIVKPSLYLQTGCNIRNADTNHVETYVKEDRLIGGNAGTNFQYARHPDVQFSISSEYKDDGTIKKITLLELDPVLRANHYLAGMALQYLASDAQVIEYNGIVFIALDGAISQVTWQVGESGASTNASRNTEHQIWVAPYPARRRAEVLASSMIDKVWARANPGKVDPANPFGKK